MLEMFKEQDKYERKNLNWKLNRSCLVHRKYKLAVYLWDWYHDSWMISSLWCCAVQIKDDFREYALYASRYPFFTASSVRLLLEYNYQHQEGFLSHQHVHGEQHCAEECLHIYSRNQGQLLLQVISTDRYHKQLSKPIVRNIVKIQTCNHKHWW